MRWPLPAAIYDGKKYFFFTVLPEDPAVIPANYAQENDGKLTEWRKSGQGRPLPAIGSSGWQTRLDISEDDDDEDGDSDEEGLSNEKYQAPLSKEWNIL